jgi:hypothetical protein
VRPHPFSQIAGKAVQICWSIAIQPVRLPINKRDGRNRSQRCALRMAVKALAPTTGGWAVPAR